MNIQLIFPDGGVVDEQGTMMVGANHLIDVKAGKERTLCGLSTARTETHCWSYYDPDPTDYDTEEERLLENVECDDCEQAFLRRANGTKKREGATK